MLGSALARRTINNVPYTMAHVGTALPSLSLGAFPLPYLQAVYQRPIAFDFRRHRLRFEDVRRVLLRKGTLMPCIACCTGHRA